MTDIPINKSAFLPLAIPYTPLSSSRLNVASSKVFSGKLIVQVSHSSAVPTTYASYNERTQLLKKPILRRVRKIYELSPAGKAAKLLSPRFLGEVNADYARRLKEAHPGLPLQDYATMAEIGPRNLKKLPEFNYLTRYLLAVKAACPRKNEELATDYAHRLQVAYPKLKIQEISCLTGLIEPKLQYKQIFRRTSPSAWRAGIMSPRKIGESDIEYARRLMQAHPSLSIKDYSFLSGASDNNLRSMTFFSELSPLLKNVKEMTPRMNKESHSSYARRLKLKNPRLTIRECMAITEGSKSTIQKLAEFKKISRDAQLAKIETPKVFNETNSQYARRLKKSYPKLKVSEITGLTGVSESNLRYMPEFKTLSALGKVANSSTPCMPGEASLDYAQRLRLHYPSLSFNDLSVLSGISEKILRYWPRFKLLSKHGELAKKATPRRISETNLFYAKRIMREHPYIGIKDCSVLPDISEPRIRKIFKRMRFDDSKYPKVVAEFIAPPRPRSPSFNEQFNTAVLREMYRDELAIEEILPNFLPKDEQ